jgi:hypothetical protein
MTNTFKIATVALALTASSLTAGQAQAKCSSGFIANALCNAGVIDKQTANTLDRGHQVLGNPLDRAAPVIAESVVPGSGAVIGSMQQYNRIKRHYLPGRGSHAPRPQLRPTPGPQAWPQPQMAFGNFCHTPAGRFGPGRVAPIGSQCTCSFGAGWSTVWLASNRKCAGGVHPACVAFKLGQLETPH